MSTFKKNPRNGFYSSSKLHNMVLGFSKALQSIISKLGADVSPWNFFMNINNTVFRVEVNNIEVLSLSNNRFILDSKRSDECIDSTIIAILVDIMLQFQTSGVVSDGKVNILVINYTITMVYACVVHGCFNRQSIAGEVQSPRKFFCFFMLLNVGGSYRLDLKKNTIQLKSVMQNQCKIFVQSTLVELHHRMRLLPIIKM
ncbi:hypothetical protein AGLY_012213 [Aphis glycines]|uniref:Uncharacterized protein n=1 Tax=Aphis glycines TaxID=307491 RepID=A0A6G0TBK4_APHGL|nr:hypothetical protein AGLY_012213 [Aphis glycines]